MEEENQVPKFRDVRRYFCDYCGISRSKKSLITAHVLAHHKEEMSEENANEGAGEEGGRSNICQECGATFKKPAHLKQHMQSHSLERPFICSVADCTASYRRKDHLNRHFLQHQGKLFKCPIEDCGKEFAFKGNMKRHVKELHSEDSPDNNSVAGKEQHVCQEMGCGKVFKFASKLKKHEDSHVKLDSIEAFCSEPNCMKYFSNEQSLRDHVQSCHRYITCEICGTKQLKKNIKRHLLSHELGTSSERIKCEFEGCLHTFSTKSNLHQHVKAVHQELRPFVCGFTGCSMRFSYKHVRDNHKKSVHVYTPGDFVESDEQFQSRPRGGRKRTIPSVEMLIQKRVTPPQVDPTVDQDASFNCSHRI